MGYIYQHSRWNQFSPVLIADGVKQVSGSAGYGLQPRTAIGQRADGVIALLVIDGRDVSILSDARWEIWQIFLCHII